MQSERVSIPGIRQILVIASGKGGVGKSTVSVNLALALARLGYKIGLFDGDVHGPDLPLMLGVRRKEAAYGSQAEVGIALSSEAQKNLKKKPALERFGIKVMSIGLLVGEAQPVIPDTNLIGRMVIQLLTSVEWGELDFLLVDSPPGTGEPQITLAQKVKIGGVVLVTTPQDVALLDTTKALNLYRSRGIPVLGLVENMSYYICPVCGDNRELFPRSSREEERAVKNPEIPVIGRIPINPEVGRAGDRGIPVVAALPEGEITLIFMELARKVAEKARGSGLSYETGPGIKIARREEAPEKTELNQTPITPEEPGANPGLLEKIGRASSPAFTSQYLEQLAQELAEKVQQRLSQKTGRLERTEAEMREILEYYREALREKGESLPAPLQKELIAFILERVLPGN